MSQPTKSHQCDLCRNNAHTNADANTDAGNAGRSRIRCGDVDSVTSGNWIVAFGRNVVAGVLAPGRKPDKIIQKPVGDRKSEIAGREKEKSGNNQ